MGGGFNLVLNRCVFAEILSVTLAAKLYVGSKKTLCHQDETFTYGLGKLEKFSGSLVFIHCERTYEESGGGSRDSRSIHKHVQNKNLWLL